VSGRVERRLIAGRAPARDRRLPPAGPPSATLQAARAEDESVTYVPGL